MELFLIYTNVSERRIRPTFLNWSPGHIILILIYLLILLGFQIRKTYSFHLFVQIPNCCEMLFHSFLLEADSYFDFLLQLMRQTFIDILADITSAYRKTANALRKSSWDSCESFYIS